MAFSSEVATGSREENASKQKTSASRSAAPRHAGTHRVPQAKSQAASRPSLPKHGARIVEAIEKGHPTELTAITPRRGFTRHFRATPTRPRKVRPDDRLRREPQMCNSRFAPKRALRNDRSSRCALCFRPAQMLIQPRHDLHKIAGPRAVIELGGENTVPAIAAGPRRPRQAEDERRARDTRSGATLDRRCADLGVAQHMERDGETIHPLFE